MNRPTIFMVRSQTVNQTMGQATGQTMNLSIGQFRSPKALAHGKRNSASLALVPNDQLTIVNMEQNEKMTSLDVRNMVNVKADEEVTAGSGAYIGTNADIGNDAGTGSDADTGCGIITKSDVALPKEENGKRSKSRKCLIASAAVAMFGLALMASLTVFFVVAKNKDARQKSIAMNAISQGKKLSGPE